MSQEQKQDLKAKYDLVVIGGGPSGVPIVLEYAKLNPEKKIALIDDKNRLGGAAVFDGPLASKVVLMSASHLQDLQRLQTFGIEIEPHHYNFAWQKLIERKNQLTQRVSSDIYKEIKALPNIELIRAKVRFDGKKVLMLKQKDTTYEIGFKKCVIAIGTVPSIPPFKGNAVDKAWLSKDFFDTMELPKSISIIGSGVVAIESAQMFSAFGVQVNLISRTKTILNKRVDEDMASVIIQKMEEDKNITLYMNARVNEINHDGEKFEVTALHGRDHISIYSQRVLIATGRKPEVEDMHLQYAKIAYDRRGVQVDAHLKSTNENVYANGTVAIEFPKHFHTAKYGAHIIAQNLLLEHDVFKADFEQDTWSLFSRPNVVVSGITERMADLKDLDFVVEKYPFSKNIKAQIEGRTEGYIKYIVDASNQRILGIGIVGDNAHILAGEAAMITAKKMTLRDVVNISFPHPTLSEVFSSLAKQMLGESLEEKLKQPFFKALLKLERFL